MRLSRCLAALALFGGLGLTPLHADRPLLTPHTPILVPGGPGGFDWMMVDSPSQRLFATHPGKQTLVVLDLKTGTVQQVDTDGEINGIAVDAADGKIFTAGGNQKVVIFDDKTLARTGEIPLTGPADDVVLDPKSGTVYVDHDDGTEVWAIDAKTQQITTSVTVAGAPEYVLYDPAVDRLYQNIKPANCIQLINPTTNKVEATWPTAPVTSPHGLAIDTKTRRLFTAGNGKVSMVDAKTGKMIASIDIAPGYVDQIAFDQAKGRLYCGCGGGMISVVQETRKELTLLGNVPDPKKAHTLAIDPQTHDVWISYADDKNSYLQKYSLP